VLADWRHRDFLDVLCEIRAHSGRVRIQRFPNTLHAGLYQGSDVSQLRLQGIRPRLQQLPGYVADLSLTIDQSSLSPGEQSLCTQPRYFASCAASGPGHNWEKARPSK
jgi:hypothetical protein